MGKYEKNNHLKWKSLSCVPLCYPMDYTVHEILQARILEWVAIPFSRVSFQPRDWTHVSSIVGRFFTSWATGEALKETVIAMFKTMLVFLQDTELTI